MAINLFDSGGYPLERQRFTWKEQHREMVRDWLRQAVLQEAGS